jgi:hypothetical protein
MFVGSRFPCAVPAPTASLPLCHLATKGRKGTWNFLSSIGKKAQAFATRKLSSQSSLQSEKHPQKQKIVI